MRSDPNIIFQLGKGVTPLLSPVDIQNQQLEREAGMFKMNALRQSAADDAAYRGVLQSGATPDQIPNKLFQAGLGKQGQEFQKYQNDQAKTQADTQKAKLEAGIKQLEAIGQIMSTVKDQQSHDLARQQISGIVGAEAAANIPAIYDPATIERNKAQAMSVKDRMEQERKRYEFDNPSADARLQAQTSTANNANTVDASRENAAATRDVASATRAAAGMQRDQATEMKLADDYRAQSKDFKAVGDAYAQINSTLDKATHSPAATLAAATKFMKLLDPGSVVRESELGMALQASGVFDRATNYVNTLARGKVLTATQVADFKNITQQIYGAAQKGQQAIDADYSQKAKAYNLRPEMVTQDLGQNKSPAAPKKAIKRTGTLNGRKVVEYIDGSIDYAN